MCATDYINLMVSTNEAIYIDTASLMDIENLEMFIDKAEGALQGQDRKIIVPRAVCLELTRHLGSQHPEKQEKAARALEILGEHLDIFDVHDEDLREEEALKAFADSEILAELTLNRKACGQLLITNDRRLSEDAYKLNEQVSCRGHKVMVCFISRFGDLRKCECAKIQPAFSQDDATRASASKVVFVPAPDCRAPHVAASEDEDPEPRFKISRVLIPIGTFAAGFLTCKFGKSAIKLIKSLL